MRENDIKKIVEETVAAFISEQKGNTNLRYEKPHLENPDGSVPIEVSGRHVHLSDKDVEKLFGSGYKLKKLRELSQPGQYVCEERVVLKGPKGELKNVAVLGPPREATQVEISVTDCNKIGVRPVFRMSGNLSGAEEICIVNEKREIVAKNSTIVPLNHIHMNYQDAEAFNVKDGDVLDIYVDTDRPVIFKNVTVRVSPDFKLAMHIDYDEANGCGFQKGDTGNVEIPNTDFQSSKQLSETNDGLSVGQEGITVEKILTEECVDKAYRNGIRKIIIKKRTIVTPLAKDKLREKKLKLQMI